MPPPRAPRLPLPRRRGASACARRPRAGCALLALLSACATASPHSQRPAPAAQAAPPKPPTVVVFHAHEHPKAHALVALDMPAPPADADAREVLARAHVAAIDQVDDIEDVQLVPMDVDTLVAESVRRHAWALLLHVAVGDPERGVHSVRATVSVAVLDASTHNLIATLSGAAKAEGAPNVDTSALALTAAFGSALRGLPKLVAALPALDEQGIVATR